MMNAATFSILTGLFLTLISGSIATCRLKDQIALSLPKSKLQCFRLLNATHQVGCQSSISGNVGTVIELSPENVHEVIERFTDSDELLIALVNINNLNKDIIGALYKSPIVNGILLYGMPETAFSEDGDCPANEFSLYNQSSCKPWNAKFSLHPNGFRFLDWKKPIFYIDDESERELIVGQCFRRFNTRLLSPSEYSTRGQRCRAKMTMFMHAAGDSEICLRRQQLLHSFESLSLCDPIVGSNAFYVVPALYQENKTNIMWLSTQIDSFSAFASAPGGDISVLTSVLTLLGIADAIGKKLELFESRAKATNRQILLSFFNGESLGYIGSNRAAYDMMHNNFPRKPENFRKGKVGPTLHFEDISFFLDLQHFGISSADTNRYYFHVDGENHAVHHQMINEVISFLSTGLNTQGLKSGIADPSKESQVPPSSYQAFLRHNRSIPGLVMSPDTADHYKFGAVHSFVDVKVLTHKALRGALVEHVKKVSTGILYAITGFVHGDSQSSHDFTVRKEYLETLVDCLFVPIWNCSYFDQVVPNYDGTRALRDLYTMGPSAALFHVIRALLVQSLGETHATSNVKTAAQCETLNPSQSVYYYTWAFNNESEKELCYRTSMFVTNAESPAFARIGLNHELMNYSTWVESVWDPHHLEIFLDGTHSTTTHVLCVVVLITTCVFLALLDWKHVNPLYRQPILEDSGSTVYYAAPTPAATAEERSARTSPPIAGNGAGNRSSGSRENRSSPDGLDNANDVRSTLLQE